MLILPNMEQGPLYNSISPAPASYPTNGFNQNWKGLRGARVPTLICPSDPAPDTPWNANGGSVKGWARGNYACNAGGIHQPNGSPGWSGPSGYSSNVGYQSTVGGASPVYASAGSFGGGPVPDGTRGGGVMCINWGSPVHTIADGSANTVLLADVRSGSALSPNDSRGVWALGYPGASVIAGPASWDITGVNNRDDSADDCFGCVNLPQDAMGAWPGCPFQQATSRSKHTGGVQVAMADGSVRFVKNNTSQTVWWCMCMRDDGLTWTDNN